MAYILAVASIHGPSFSHFSRTANPEQPALTSPRRCLLRRMENFFRKAGMLCLLLILIGIPSSCKTDPMEHKPGEVLVKFKPDSSPEAVEALRNKMGLEKIKEIPKLGVTLYRIKSKLTPTEMVEKYKDNPHIEYIEPNYAYRLD